MTNPSMIAAFEFAMCEKEWFDPTPASGDRTYSDTETQAAYEAWEAATITAMQRMTRYTVLVDKYPYRGGGGGSSNDNYADEEVRRMFRDLWSRIVNIFKPKPLSKANEEK